MADRVISVRLRIAVAEARRDAKAAADAITGIARSADQAGRSAAGMSRLGAAARAAVESTAAIGAVGVGGLAAMTVSVGKTGVAYNNLEQTSRAALTTVLGSAAAATAQMNQLREFGQTSPFPRQVWIQAQQTLLAFGMEAEKIIPTFEAIQDAVAATGGSGQQITEITQILARIQSTGKVTAEELNELGYRGIDAAKLVGEAMGKSAGEVRADITAQAISGQQFLDVLTQSMATHFEGAAEGVKATWSGATDRVKGALRDIGGLLASPLVDPSGGGAAVEWANSIADALRALEDRLEPAMAALTDRAEPALDALNDKLEELAEWIRTADFAELRQQIQAMLPAIAAGTAGLTAMGAQALSNVPVIGNLVSGFKPLPVAITAAALASPELRGALLDLLTAIGPLIAAVANMATGLAGALGPALSVVAEVLQPVIAVVGFLADRFGDLPGPIQGVVTALLALKGMQMAGMFTGLSTAAANFRSEMDAQRKFAEMAGTSVNGMGAAYSVAATKVSSAAGTIRGALSSAVGFLGGPWGAAIGLGITALSAFSMAQDSAADSAGQFTFRIDEQTGSLTRNNIAELYSHIADEAKVLGDESARVSEILPQLGLTVDDVVGYLLGEEDAIGRVNNALKANNTWSRQLQNWLENQAGAIARSAEVQKDAAGAANRYGSAVDGAAGATEGAAGAAAGASGAVNSFASALYGAGDAADSVATRSQQLQAALGSIYDAQFALQEASDGFQGKLQSLQGAFANNDKAATKSANTADRYGDAMRRQQKIVRDTQKQLEDLAEAQREAEKEAAEAAQAARQRQLDELFGKQFDVQSTMDAFQSALAQASKDMQDNLGVAGSRSLLGFTEGALANRERMRSIVQSAQAAIQAERDRGASPSRISQVSAGLANQLAAQAKAWGLNAAEVKQYTDAILAFGGLAQQKVSVDLSKVTQDFAEQRAEIQENKREQLENAKASAATAAAQSSSASAVSLHTAALTGNSESAVKNRETMRQLVKAAQDELTQMHLNGASKDELKRRGEELATQLMNESIQLGFTEEDVRQYTDTIKVSAEEIARYPTLHARANVAGAMTTVQNFVAGVNKQLAKIQKNFEINVRTGSEYINSIAGGRHFAADGGYISGPGGPRDDVIPAMLSNGEYVVNAAATARNRTLLEVINRGGEVSRPGFARGGYVDPMMLNFIGRPSTGLQQLYDGIMGALSPFAISNQAPLQWAASQVGKPYLWGGVGPAGYDCSGFMSAITNVIQGRGPHARRFATGSFPTGDFAAGPGNFMIGSRRGNPGHMAGTLHGVNVESRGGEGVVVGKRARGAFDSLFGGNVWHLKGYADGGLVSGDPPFDLLSPLGKHFDELVKGSYATGTDFVPMDGVYQLHRGEAVVPAAQNAGSTMVLEIRGDGSQAADFVIDQLNKADATGRIKLRRR